MLKFILSECFGTKTTNTTTNEIKWVKVMEIALAQFVVSSECCLIVMAFGLKTACAKAKQDTFRVFII